MNAKTLLAVAWSLVCVCACDEAARAVAGGPPSAHDELTSLIEQDARNQWAARSQATVPAAAPLALDVVRMAPFYVHALVPRITETKYESPLAYLIRTGNLWEKVGRKTTSLINISYGANKAGQARTQVGYVIKW